MVPKRAEGPCIWCRNLTTLNRSRLTRQTHLCNRQISKAKSAHYSKTFAKQSVIIGHYGRHLTKSYTVALKCTCLIIREDISSFFISKISIIHSFFPSDSHSRVLNPHKTGKVLLNLTCVTANESCSAVSIQITLNTY